MTPWFPNPGDLQNGIFIQRLAQAAALHCKVTICHFYQGLEFSESKTEVENLPVIQLEFPAGSGIGHQLNKRKHLRACLEQLYKENPIDLIHGQQLTADALWFQQWADKKRIPTVYSIHWSGFTDDRFNGWPWIKKSIVRQLVKKSAMLLPVSKFLSEQLKGKGLKGRQQVLPNVVTVTEDLIENSNKHKVFTFCMVADLDDSIKRISSAIQAFVIYQRTYPEDQFAIVGGGPDEEKLREYLGKFDGVNFMGRMTQPQAMEELSKCHATIINSRVETFSVVALESAALGNFTLSTPCGGPEETAKDTSALILEDFERTTLIQAMKQVRTSYEAKGLPKPQKLAPFSQEAIGEKLEEIYNSVVKSSTPT
ncbi:MAG: hypothetical protein SchgKO_22850 [Schleiferiaceae bacterium]